MRRPSGDQRGAAAPPLSSVSASASPPSIRMRQRLALASLSAPRADTNAIHWLSGDQVGRGRGLVAARELDRVLAVRVRHPHLRHPLALLALHGRGGRRRTRHAARPARDGPGAHPLHLERKLRRPGLRPVGPESGDGSDCRGDGDGDAATNREVTRISVLLATELGRPTRSAAPRSGRRSGGGFQGGSSLRSGWAVSSPPEIRQRAAQAAVSAIENSQAGSRRARTGSSAAPASPGLALERIARGRLQGVFELQQPLVRGLGRSVLQALAKGEGPRGAIHLGVGGDHVADPELAARHHPGQEGHARAVDDVVDGGGGHDLAAQRRAPRSARRTRAAGAAGSIRRGTGGRPRSPGTTVCITISNAYILVWPRSTASSGRGRPRSRCGLASSSSSVGTASSARFSTPAPTRSSTKATKSS